MNILVNKPSGTIYIWGHFHLAFYHTIKSICIELSIVFLYYVLYEIPYKNPQQLKTILTAKRLFLV